ncbi:MAG: hypothetical protein K6F92_08280 [Lachnospiraceae bacterium]|nr:hypothetical protein [Lachnospiraceae bacterium]
MRKIIYYSDELNDEFSRGGITPVKIDARYSYAGTFLRPVLRAVIYHIFAKIIAFVYMKLVHGHRIIGADKLRGYSHRAHFVYANHTNAVPDAVIPTMINLFGSTYVIVHPDNVSMPVLGRITPALGAIPLPDDREAYKNYQAYIHSLCAKNRTIMIYPEAHIWPYYTKIRPFKADSFHYPVMENVPVFCFTNTYQKRRFFKKPRIVTYIEGPFFPDETLKKPERIRDLRDRVYDAMTKNSAHSNVEYITYMKRE